jgi:hypothetical protein
MSVFSLCFLKKYNREKKWCGFVVTAFKPAFDGSQSDNARACPRGPETTKTIWTAVREELVQWRSRVYKPSSSLFLHPSSPKDYVPIYKS